MGTSRVFAARDDDHIAGTFTLQRKKPWAIDISYFTPCQKVIYLINMAVAPDRQHTGVGRLLLDEAMRQAQGLRANAIRLDAYDAPAGAGGFYRKCGYAHVGGKSYRGVPLMYFELMTHLR
jgi:GNAT superfamily N-acetyltransferase